MSHLGPLDGLMIGTIGALADFDGYLQVSHSQRIPLRREPKIDNVTVKGILSIPGYTDVASTISTLVTDMSGKLTQEVADTLYQPKSGDVTVTGALNIPGYSNVASTLDNINTNLSGKLTQTTADTLYQPKTGNVTVTGTLAIPGYADVAATLQSLSTNTSVYTSSLLQNYATYLTTGVNLGGISSGVTVGALVAAYPTLGALLAAMLDLRATQLSVVGAGLSFTNGGQYEYEVGNTINFTLTIALDRGDWSPTESSGGAIPYGEVTSASMNNPFTGAFISFSIPAQTRNMTFSTTLSHTLQSTLNTWNVTSVSVITAQGEAAYNNAGTLFQRPQTLWTPSNALIFKNYAYVYVDNNVNTASANSLQSNTPSTQRVLHGTTTVVVASHVATTTIWVPVYQPNTLEVWDLLYSRWSAQTLGDVWSRTLSSKTINGVTVPYWYIQFLNTNRDPIDVRIKF